MQWCARLLHIQKVREELRRADEKIGDLRTELGQERTYISRVKKERDAARAKSDDAVADADCARRELGDARAPLGSSDAAYKRKITDMEASLADALRKKNRERVAMDGVLKKKITMNCQRETEKALNVFLDACDTTFRGSGILFDAEATSSSEDDAAAAAPPLAQAKVREDITPLQGDGPAPSTAVAPELTIAEPAAQAEKPADSSASSTTSSESR